LRSTPTKIPSSRRLNTPERRSCHLERGHEVAALIKKAEKNLDGERVSAYKIA
jgi:hypothetical protein